jgi:hypothetical protein
MNTVDTYTNGKITIKISDLCNLTYPCQHYVSFDNGSMNNNKLMSGVDICKLLKKYNIPVPAHFKRYIDFIQISKHLDNLNIILYL